MTDTPPATRRGGFKGILDDLPDSFKPTPTMSTRAYTGRNGGHPLSKRGIAAWARSQDDLGDFDFITKWIVLSFQTPNGRPPAGSHRS